MCEFHYDFVNNEPFYFCDNHNCVCSREIEEDFFNDIYRFWRARLH
jgi:hypothetical protein